MEALRHTNECVREPPHIHKAWELVSLPAFACLPAWKPRAESHRRRSCCLRTLRLLGKQRCRLALRSSLTRCIIKLPNKRLRHNSIPARTAFHANMYRAARYLDHSWCEIPPEHLIPSARAWNEPRRRRADTGARKFRVSLAGCGS